MIKLLIGGSPCTYWSIAQKNHRETEASGLGWELFKNYLIAKEKFKPDFFLYENNKSAAQPIKDQIKKELQVNEDDLFTCENTAQYIEINSALVSAQNRKRFYVHNCGFVEQPEDRGILLRDILESGVTDRDKGRAVLTSAGRTTNREYFKKHQGNMVAEPVGIGYRNRREADGKLYRRFETHNEPKANALTTVQTDSMLAEPLQVAEPIDYKVRKGSEISVTEKNIHGLRKNGATESESFVYYTDGKTNALTTSHIPKVIHSYDKPIYEVKDGKITIKGKPYPIKLADGFYIIRKLTVTECCRLQTMPDDYCRGVSNAQAYKGLGNGWTAEVIIHILNGALANVPKDEEIVVLSMYDGIGTGRYCLDKMGFTNVKYFAYEIDKYAMQISESNYPDIIQMGDAFDVRNPEWELKY